MEASQTARASARETAAPAGPIAWIVLAIGVLGGVVLVIAELSLIFQVDTLTSGTCRELADAGVRDRCEASGLEQHSGALILLGLFAVAMAVGASRGASVPAALALIVAGLVVIAIAVLIDLPKTKADGLLEPFYESGKAKPGAGFHLELLGAAMCIGAGALGLLGLRRT